MTLVSVIGDFFSSVAPVFYEFKDKIDTHIIISDDSKRDDRLAKKFQKGVKKFIDKYNLNIKTLYYSIDEDSFESLERAKEFILKNSTGDIYINTTDGLSSVNTFFSLRMIPLKAKIISELVKASGNEVLTLSKSLNLLESYALSNILSKNFFLVPLFLPLPPFNRAELFIDKEELKNFHRNGFLTVVIVLDLEKYGKLKISILYDRKDNFFEINFTSESAKLIEKLKKRQKDIIDFLGSKYRLRITYTNQAPELP